jgi:branched-chain amino acid transport system permease protein
MEKLLAVLLAGTMIGLVYGLIGLGHALTYRASGYVNFAQGEFVVVGVLGTVGFMTWWDLPFLAAAALAICIAVLIGAGIEFFLVRRLKSPTLLRVAILTLGVAFALHGVARQLFGTTPYSLDPFPGLPSSISVAYERAVLPGQAVWILGLTLLVFAGATWFLAGTTLGRQMRAVAADKEIAQAFGIPASRLILYVFGAAAAIAALSGVTVGSVLFVTYSSGLLLGLKGLVAAIVGGLARPGGAIWGGLILGIAESATAGYLEPGWQDGAAFALLILVLLVRPDGLLRNRLAAREVTA